MFNNNKVLMVVARYIPFKEKSYYEFPLGMAYVSSCLKKAGYEVDILNLNHYDDVQDLLIEKQLAKEKYGYVLTGGLSAHYRTIKFIIDAIRKFNKDIIIIIGGGIVTSLPNLMFNFLRPDFIVLGEGEITTVELINELEKNEKNILNVNGIGFIDEVTGNLIITPERDLIDDLDTIPYPDLAGFEVEKYLEMQQPNDSLYLYIDDEPRFYPIISSRGCPYSCTFCYHPLGYKYRSRSVENFMGEVEYVIEKHNVNNFAIFDELLSANKERLLEICIRFKNLPKKVNWMCQLRVDNVDLELLRVMKEAGCFLISYGLESANDCVLRSMNKNINVAQIENALKLTREAQIGVQGYFIFGDTIETQKMANDTLTFWEQNKDYHILMGYIRPYPGSILWNKETQKEKYRDDVKQLELLESCISMPPNLSAMDDTEWFILQKDVQKALILNDHFGKQIESKVLDNKKYEIKVQCPHCNEIITYKNFSQRILGVFKLSCRHCNQAMNISPLIFQHVRNDYARNFCAYSMVLSGRYPIAVTPCMNPAEFLAMHEIYLPGIKIDIFLDIDDDKAEKTYLGTKILKRNKKNIDQLSIKHYFLIPLTRFANRIFDNLVKLGVNPEQICRLDEIDIFSEDFKNVQK